jgi:First C2 domain of RPGR-interacting protein 1
MHDNGSRKHACIGVPEQMCHSRLFRAPQAVNSQDGLLEEDDGMYASFRFFNGPESVTREVRGKAASFDYSMAIRILVNAAFLHYMQDESMTVTLHRVRGFEQVPLAKAHVPLEEALRAFANGQGAVDMHANSVPGTSQGTALAGTNDKSEGQQGRPSLK